MTEILCLLGFRTPGEIVLRQCLQQGLQYSEAIGGDMFGIERKRFERVELVAIST